MISVSFLYHNKTTFTNFFYAYVSISSLWKREKKNECRFGANFKIKAEWNM